MDTSTHFVIGISIAGLAHIDPSVTSSPVLAQTVLIGSIIGSQAPDFDSVSRFFGGNKAYIKNHRGITHSLPALLIWPTIITFLLSIFSSGLSYTHLWLWTFISVFFHVFLDSFNAYGTQVFRPFSNKWVSLNVINIFDPFIFSIHLISIILWAIHYTNPRYIFVIAFTANLLYLFWRLIAHRALIRFLKQKYRLKGKITLLPTIRWSTWNFIEETLEEYKLGIVRNKIFTLAEIKRKEKEHKSISYAKKDKKVEAFHYFTNYSYPSWKKTSYGYEVRFVDLRYRYNGHYPFIVIVVLNEEYSIIDSYIGWIYNEGHADKKIKSILDNSV